VGAVKVTNCCAVSPGARLPRWQVTCPDAAVHAPGDPDRNEPAGRSKEISTPVRATELPFARVADASVAEPALTTGFGATARSKVISRSVAPAGASAPAPSPSATSP
jgi:hypothetical protein